MSEEYLKNAQDLTKSQKHEFVSHSPTWIQEMLAHLKTTKPLTSTLTPLVIQKSVSEIMPDSD